jgi:hypothetical protein
MGKYKLNPFSLKLDYYEPASTSGGITHATAVGTDTYTVTITGVTAYADADAYLIRFTNGNTGTSSLNINGLGAKTLYRNNDGVLLGGDVWSGAEMLCVFNTTTDGFQCIGTTSNALFSYVTNADSVTLTKGMPVYAFGGTGDRMTVKRAKNTSDATSAQTVGIVLSTSIAANQKLSATICWTDPTGSANVSSSIDNRISRLRNNLDLKIIKDGIIFYPWKLNPDDPASAATNVDENDVDNVEKVEIDNAQPGVYTIQVTHKTSLTGGSQVFSLIANATNGLNLNTSDYEFDNSIFIYPNPATTILNFQVKNDITIDTVSVTDLSGKQIFKASNTMDNAIDISNLSSGVYFVTFTSQSNSITKKFIKE